LLRNIGRDLFFEKVSYRLGIAGKIGRDGRQNNGKTGGGGG
jgi:hypothetical protein